MGQGKIFEGVDISSDVKESAEVCVIGSGAGGAVAAKELAEKGHSVVLLEEGSKWDKSNYPKGALECFRKMYRDGGATVCIGRPPVFLPIGKALGGTTKVNSGTCLRMPDKVLRRWRREFGIDGVEPEQMKPYFERVEKIVGAAPVSPRVMGRNNEIFLEGARKLGYSCGPLIRNADADCHGCGICTLGCPSDGKRSTDLNYVPMAVSHGAKVYCDARAEKIIVKEGQAMGVSGSILDAATGKPKHTFQVNCKIVAVAAGTIHSPMLLKKNGLANSSGWLGKNLRIHPGIRVSALFDQEINGHLGVPQAAYVDEFAAEGVMMEGVFVVPLLSAPNLPYFGEKNKELMFHYRNIASFGAMILDETQGTVRQGALGHPLILYNLCKEDVKKASRAIAYAAEIWLAAGAKRVFPAVAWMPELNSIKDVRVLLKRGLKASELEMMAFHPMGTCRMGSERMNSVCDPYGETWDVRNLFVTDGSLFPTCLGVNPMESIMAFANRSADYIHRMKLSSS
jgi:choline dehydrogenase-like flavoprotein